MQPNKQQPPLWVYCAASVEPAISAIAAAFTRETGAAVHLDTGPSGMLFEKIKRSKKGDMIIPAAQDPYLDRAVAEGSVTEIMPLASLRLVLAANPHAPPSSLTLQDLLTGRRRYAIAHEEAAAGLATLEALAPLGDWQQFAKGAQAILPTVTDVARAIRDGVEVDCGIVWDATARQYGLPTVDLAELASSRAVLAVGILAMSKHAATTRQFADYLAAPDKGRVFFKTLGYETVEC